MLILIAVVVFLTSSAGAELIIYAGMGLAGNAYLQTFASVAYDIRKAGDVTIQQPESSKNRYVKP